MADLQVTGRERVADWIETSLLMRGTRQLGRDELHRLAAEEIGVGDAQINLGLKVMAMRQRVLGAGYPFLVDELAVRARAEAANFPYSSLLLMTPLGVARQLLGAAPTAAMAELFEDLTTVAVARLLGDGGSAVRFAWPSKAGRPPEFHHAIEWLAAQMGIEAGSSFRPPRRKDGGVDVVAWRPFPDGRSGVPVMLVQCTLQADILSKAFDIDVRYWSGWLKLDAEPLSALAIPQTIEAGTVWDELAVRCLILERVRLTGLLDPSLFVEGQREFVTEQVDRLHGHLKAAEL